MTDPSYTEKTLDQYSRQFNYIVEDFIAKLNTVDTQIAALQKFIIKNEQRITFLENALEQLVTRLRGPT